MPQEALGHEYCDRSKTEMCVPFFVSNSSWQSDVRQADGQAMQHTVKAHIKVIYVFLF